MRSWFRAAAFLLVGTSSALAIPPSAVSSIEPKVIKTVAGSIGPDHVSIHFSSPCQGCFADSAAEVEIDLSIQAGENSCDASDISLNGAHLAPRGWGDHKSGHVVFPLRDTGRLSEIDVYASWNLTCLEKDISLLSVAFNKLPGQVDTAEVAGFAMSFSQQEHPVIIHLQDQRVHDISTPETLKAWTQVKCGSSPIIVPPSLEQELSELYEIKVQIGKLHDQYKRKECMVASMIAHDFKACHGIKCMLQTAMRKAPDAIALVRAHFQHHSRTKHDQLEDTRKQEVAIQMDATDQSVSLDELEELDNVLDRPPPPFDGPRPEPHSPPHPPEHGAPHHQPDHHQFPHDEEPPHHQPEYDRPPPHAEVSPPSQPSDHALLHHGGPPHGHSPPPWAHQWGHHKPHFGQHGPRHHRSLLVSVGSFCLILLFVGVTCILITRKTSIFRSQRKKQHRAARREERRTRAAYKRAACQHKWSRWWSQFRQPETTNDYDEKRERILSQESQLEDVMQNEIRDLRRAHELVGELMRAEEDRQRMYHEVNFGTPSTSSTHQGAAITNMYHSGEGSSNNNRHRHYNNNDMLLSSSLRTLPPYQAPPPSYEAELEGEITVVDGFRYNTPSNTDDTPDSSVVDCNSRVSFDTGRSASLKDF